MLGLLVLGQLAARRPPPLSWLHVMSALEADNFCCKAPASQSDASLQVLSMAVRHRRVGSHELNMESSRSHSIFTGEPTQCNGVQMPWTLFWYS